MRLGKKFAASIFSGILGLGLALFTQAAPLTNASFETLTGSPFAGWNNIGQNVSASDSSYLSIIPNGSYSALLSNGATTVNGSAGGSTTNLSAANSALGITVNGNLATNNADSVSGIYQTFDVSANSVLSFSYAFATNENPSSGLRPDFGFFTLNGHDLVQLATNANATIALNTGATQFDLISGDFATWTGFNTFTYGVVLLAGNTYTIGFGAANAPSGVSAVSSALIVDNLVLTPATVPLPSVAWAGLALFGGLGALQISRRRKAAVIA